MLESEDDKFYINYIQVPNISILVLYESKVFRTFNMRYSYFDKIYICDIIPIKLSLYQSLNSLFCNTDYSITEVNMADLVLFNISNVQLKYSLYKELEEKVKECRCQNSNRFVTDSVEEKYRLEYIIIIKEKITILKDKIALLQ